jgi:RNA polymerase sigma-70 factor (ECF subfamily)
MFHIGKLSDADVVERVLAGKTEAFEILVVRYMGAVQAVAYAHTGNHTDAEDVVQDVFLRAFKSLDGLRTPSKFRSWLMTITRNTARNHLRKSGREVPLDAVGETAEAPPVDLETEETFAVLRQHAMKLDVNHREVLLLYYFSRQSTRDIAALLDISVDATTKRLQRARETLGRSLIDVVDVSFDRYRATKETASKSAKAIIATPVTWDVSRVAQAQENLSWFGKGLLSAKAVATIVALSIGTGVAWKVVMPAGPESTSAAREHEHALRAQASGDELQNNASPRAGQGPVSISPKESERPLLIAAADEIVGTLRQPTGIPVKGATVNAITGEGIITGVSDDNGQFRIGGLRPWPYAVSSKPSGYLADRKTQVFPGRGVVDLVLVPELSIAVQVINAQTRQPVPEFAWQYVPKGYMPQRRLAGWEERREQGEYVGRQPNALRARYDGLARLRDGRWTETEDAEGRFQVAALEEGIADIFAVAPGYALGTLRRTGLKHGEPVEDGVIELHPAPLLTGVVKGPNGKPVSEAHIFLGFGEDKRIIPGPPERQPRLERAARSNRSDSTTPKQRWQVSGLQPHSPHTYAIDFTDESGRFQTDFLPRMPRWVGVYHLLYAPAIFEVQATQGREVEMQLQVERATTLQVAVTFGGRPAESAPEFAGYSSDYSVHVEQMEDALSDMSQSVQGVASIFEIQPLHPGKVRLSGQYKLTKPLGIPEGEIWNRFYAAAPGGYAMIRGSMETPQELDIRRGRANHTEIDFPALSCEVSGAIQRAGRFIDEVEIRFKVHTPLGDEVSAALNILDGAEQYACVLPPGEVSMSIVTMLADGDSGSRRDARIEQKSFTLAPYQTLVHDIDAYDGTASISGQIIGKEESKRLTMTLYTGTLSGPAAWSDLGNLPEQDRMQLAKERQSHYRAKVSLERHAAPEYQVNGLAAGTYTFVVPIGDGNTKYIPFTLEEGKDLTLDLAL